MPTLSSRGRKTTVIDGNEKKYQYNYDEFGRLVNETNRLEDSQSYFYDDEGNLETKKDFANKTTTYEYDAKIGMINMKKIFLLYLCLLFCISYFFIKLTNLIRELKVLLTGILFIIINRNIPKDRINYSTNLVKTED